MKENRYAIIRDGKLVTLYENFHDAVYDSEFFQLMYEDVRIYQLVMINDKEVKK